jgi:hypothetical protein
MITTTLSKINAIYLPKYNKENVVYRFLILAYQETIEVNMVLTTA